LFYKMKSFTVKHENKEMQVIIPSTGDTSYDNYLEEAEREKTLDQLKKSPGKSTSKVSKEDKAGALKEYIEFKNRKRRGDIRKYY